VESSLATAPLYPISCRGLAKRESSPTCATIVTAETNATPRSAWSASMTARIRSGAVFTASSMGAVEPFDTIGHVLYFGEVIQQGGLSRGVLKVDGLDPGEVRLGPWISSLWAHVGHATTKTCSSDDARAGPSWRPRGTRSRNTSCSASGTHTAVKSPAR
jgi:hypothetical protein